MNGWNRPIAFEPPPTQATSASGIFPNLLRLCAITSRPITDWKSRPSSGHAPKIDDLLGPENSFFIIIFPVVVLSISSGAQARQPVAQPTARHSVEQGKRVTWRVELSVGHIIIKKTN